MKNIYILTGLFFTCSVLCSDYNGPYDAQDKQWTGIYHCYRKNAYGHDSAIYKHCLMTGQKNNPHCAVINAYLLKIRGTEKLLEQQLIYNAERLNNTAQAINAETNFINLRKQKRLKDVILAKKQELETRKGYVTRELALVNFTETPNFPNDKDTQEKMGNAFDSLIKETQDTLNASTFTSTFWSQEAELNFLKDAIEQAQMHG